MPEDCRAVSEVLSRVGDKWTILVVGELGHGPKALQRDPARARQHFAADADADLARTERDGLVTRTVFPTVPPRVDYELTKLGRSLLEPVSGIGLWARQNREHIEEARRRFDTTAGAGKS